MRILRGYFGKRRSIYKPKTFVHKGRRVKLSDYNRYRRTGVASRSRHVVR